MRSVEYALDAGHKSVSVLHRHLSDTFSIAIGAAHSPSDHASEDHQK